MSTIVFDKYERFGAYHWTHFEQATQYREHVLFVRDWMSECNILDAGCGDGLITHILAQSPCRCGKGHSKRKVKGIDNHALAISLAHERGVDASVQALEDIHEHFDAIFLGDVIEHLPDPAASLAHLAQYTRKLYIVTPPSQGETLHDEYHYKEWTPDDLHHFLEENGWRVTEKIIKPELMRMYFSCER